MYAIPKPSTKKQAIFTACKRQCFNKGRASFVKTNAAEDKPKGRTVNTKYFQASFDIPKKAEICLMGIKNLSMVITTF